MADYPACLVSVRCGKSCYIFAEPSVQAWRALSCMTRVTIKRLKNLQSLSKALAEFRTKIEILDLDFLPDGTISYETRNARPSSLRCTAKPCLQVMYEYQTTG